MRSPLKLPMNRRAFIANLFIAAGGTTTPSMALPPTYPPLFIRTKSGYVFDYLNRVIEEPTGACYKVEEDQFFSTLERALNNHGTPEVQIRPMPGPAG